MTEKSKYKKSGYFDFEAFEPSKNSKDDSKILSNQNKIEDFNISTDKYKKTMMRVRTIKYEIKD